MAVLINVVADELDGPLILLRMSTKFGGMEIFAIFDGMAELLGSVDKSDDVIELDGEYGSMSAV